MPKTRARARQVRRPEGDRVGRAKGEEKPKRATGKGNRGRITGRGAAASKPAMGEKKDTNRNERITCRNE